MTEPYDIDDCYQWEKYIAKDIPTVPLWIGGIWSDHRSKAPFVVIDKSYRAVWYKDFLEPVASKTVDLLCQEFSSPHILMTQAAHAAVTLAAQAFKAAGYPTGRAVITSYYDLDEPALRAAGARLGIDVTLKNDSEPTATLAGASAINYHKMDYFELASIVIPPTSNHENLK